MSTHKNRMVNTRFWNDTFISTLDPLEKLLFIYFLTNEHTDICGIYELPLKIIAIETGLDQTMLEKMLPVFDGKINYVDGWVVVKNFPKHQAKNPSIEKGIAAGLALIPRHIKAKIDTLYTASIQPATGYTQAVSNIKRKIKIKNNIKIKKETNTNVLVKKESDNEIALLISAFESQIGKMPRAKYQPAAAASLLKQHGFKRVSGAITATAAARGERFAPSIASLEELRDKWVKLENYYHREANKGEGMYHA